MFSSRFSFIAVAAILAAQLRADCLNQVAQFNPQDRTFAANLSNLPILSPTLTDTKKQTAFLVVPVPKSAVQQALNEAYPLLAQKPTLLPLPKSLNFPEGMHPVLATIGLNNDIRQGALQIDGPLRQSSTTVPFVGTGTSNTPFNAPLITYIGGTQDSRDAYLAGVVPALVSTTVGGIQAAVGGFIPKSAAYQSDGISPDGKQLFSSNAKFALLPNEVSGPGLYPEAVDMSFTSESRPRYTLQQLKNMINQPFILNSPFNGLAITTCQRNTYFFNNATTQVEWRSGNVTFGTAASRPGVSPGALQKAGGDGAGGYFGVQGFSACAQSVGFNTLGGQGCEEAARQVYREAL